MFDITLLFELSLPKLVLRFLLLWYLYQWSTIFESIREVEKRKKNILQEVFTAKRFSSFIIDKRYYR